MSSSNRSAVFRNSIKAVLDSWSALKIALQHAERPVNQTEFANWLVGAVEDYFYQNDDLMADEVADFLDDIIDAELDTEVKDGSLTEIAEKLCTYFRMCLSSKEAELAQIIQQLPLANATAQVQNVAPENDSDSDSVD